MSAAKAAATGALIIHHLSLMKPISIALQDGSTTKITVFGEADDGPVFLVFPAMGVEASYYEPFATALAELGYTVITADLRGLGHSSVRPSKAVDYGYQQMLELDYRGIFDEVEARFPGRARYVIGHSLGGQLAALFLSRYPAEASGLVLIAACSVYYRGWGWQQFPMLMVTQFYGAIAGAFGYFPGHRLGFGGKGSKTVLQDWSRQARTGRYEPTGADFDYEKALRGLQLSVLGMTIKGDNFAPHRAMAYLYQKFHPDAEVTHLHVSAAESGLPKLNHFNWARRPGYFVRRIVEWVVTI